MRLTIKITKYIKKLSRDLKMGMIIECKLSHIISYNLNVPQPPTIHLNSDQPAQLYM